MTGANIRHGNVTVPAAGTAVNLGTGQCRNITIKALAGNVGDVFIGDKDVDATTGFVLDAGEEVTLPAEKLDNIWIDVGTSAEGVTYIAVF